MKIFFFLGIFSILCFSAIAQSKSVQQVEAAVSRLVKAMEESDAVALRNIAADGLSYGHSGGKLENKEQFIAAFASGASDFNSINITGQTVYIFKKTAVVRHMLEADTNDNNKPGHVKLNVMTVWKKSGGAWKLIARQAIKPPVT